MVVGLSVRLSEASAEQPLNADSSIFVTLGSLVILGSVPTSVAGTVGVVGVVAVVGGVGDVALSPTLSPPGGWPKTAEEWLTQIFFL
jgi:hypothetical protein